MTLISKVFLSNNILNPNSRALPMYIKFNRVFGRKNVQTSGFWNCYVITINTFLIHIAFQISPLVYFLPLFIDKVHTIDY